MKCCEYGPWFPVVIFYIVSFVLVIFSGHIKMFHKWNRAAYFAQFYLDPIEGSYEKVNKFKILKKNWKKHKWCHLLKLLNTWY